MMYSRDLAKLFDWRRREYDDVEPLILGAGGQDVADAVVKATGLRASTRCICKGARIDECVPRREILTAIAAGGGRRAKGGSYAGGVKAEASERVKRQEWTDAQGERGRTVKGDAE